MLFRISVQNRGIVVGMLGVLFLTPLTTLADVFAPDSCEDLFSTDLVAEMGNEVDHRIEGLIANDSTKKVFSTRGNATDPWVRSATVWTTEGNASLDLTGASPWNSGSNFTKAGVLISPRHIVFARHFPIANGSTVVFIADDNTIVTRTLQAQRSVVFQPGAGEDVQLGVLDSDVPGSIAFYPVIPKEEMDRYLSGPQFPFLIFDQEAKANIEEINYSIGLADEHVYFNHAPATNPSTRFDFYEAQVGGDSGQPGFFFINNQPILALTVTGAGYGPFYGAYMDSINDAIVTLGNDGGYQMSTYDLSCFDMFNEAPEIVDETFILIENSLGGTFVGTTTASDALGGTTLTYAIVSGNTDEAFAIDEETGELTIDNGDAIDFETNPTFELVVSATDDWWLPSTATGTITIELEDELEADRPSVTTNTATFIGETQAILNGTISATGGQDATFRGFIYGLSSAYGATTTEAGTFSVGNFSTNLPSLTCGTTYHFKAWASNPLGGLAYGSHKIVATLACGDEGGNNGDDGGGGGGGGSGGGGSRDSDDETEDEASGMVTNPSLTPALREQILSQLKVLIKELIALGGKPSQSALVFIGAIPATSASVTTSTFVRDLDVGMSGSDVVRFQQVLIAQNKGPQAQALAANGATGLFGPLTQSALAEFQVSVGITPASGYFGPKTRVLFNGL